jgi:3-oxoadipate enol-lactonase
MGTFILVYSGASLRAQSSASTTSKNGFLELSGGTLYYEVAGEGHALVLIHGGQMDSRMWGEQFALFSKSYRVIR